VAYSSVLVTDVVGKTTTQGGVGFELVESLLAREDSGEPESAPPPVLSDLRSCLEEADGGDLVEVFHDATQAREDAARLFELGYLSLPARAATEQFFFATGRKLWARMQTLERQGGAVPDGLGELAQLLADVYFLNFSLFQSMPDSWAIGQRFPICPIHRLDEEPTCRATLADITCDSDGKIDEFVGASVDKRFLELHELVVDADGHITEPYYVGFFLLGAYQEILGDLHNLLGDTHAVHVRLGQDGDWVSGRGYCGGHGQGGAGLRAVRARGHARRDAPRCGGGGQGAPPHGCGGSQLLAFLHLGPRWLHLPGALTPTRGRLQD